MKPRSVLKQKVLTHKIHGLNLSLVIFFLTATLVTLPLSTLAQKRQPVNVERDLTLTMGLEHLESVSEMPGKISFKGDFKNVATVAYSESTKQLRFTPKKQGTATLSVHDSNGQIVGRFLITVRQSNLSRVHKEIHSLLNEIEGIQIKIINDKVIVDGEVLLPRDINRIYSVVSQYGDSASSIVHLSPISQKKIAEFIERDINNPEIHVRAVNDVFMLEGVVENDGERKRAEIIAQAYVPDVVAKPAPGVRQQVRLSFVNLITLRPAAAPEPSKMVQVVVHYVELKKDYGKMFRFQWMPNLKDDTGVGFNTGSREPGSIFGQITGTISNLLPKLNWARTHGHARILESSSVIVQDGETGRVNSTTSISLPIVGAGGVPSLATQDAGIKAEILPKIVSSGSDSIQLKVSFEVSALLGATEKSVQMSKNNLSTVVIVRSGQSAAIGGLVRNNSGSGYNKLPQDSNSNPLLSLYASKDFRRDQSQFVVFLTPVIKSSASAGSEQVKRKFRLRD